MFKEFKTINESNEKFVDAISRAQEKFNDQIISGSNSVENEEQVLNKANQQIEDEIAQANDQENFVDPEDSF